VIYIKSKTKRGFLAGVLFTCALTVFFISCPAGNLLAAPVLDEAIDKSGLIVQFYDSSSTLEMPADLSGNIESMEVLHKYRQPLHKKKTNRQPVINLIKLKPEADRQSVIEELKKTGQVEYVEENKRIKLCQAPNDPYFSQEWALTAIDVETAWERAGSATNTVVVAVIDSGIDSTHPDLKNRLDSRGYNFVDKNTDVTDVEGHGTAVAGLIAAETNNAIGIAGAGGQVNVKILPIKTVDSDGYSYLSDVIKAIDYAIDKDVNVINLSMGSDEPSDLENEAIQRALSAGITVVASAGNLEYPSRRDIYCYPASYDGVISVGAIQKNGTYASFTYHNNRVDVAAPGVDVVSCALRGKYDFTLDGTSFSAPLVAGAAAVLKSLDLSLSPADIREIICDTATDKGASGKDNYYGYGILNMSQAVLQAAPPTIPVNAIQLDTGEVQISMGETYQLTAAIDPVNATNQNLSWSSDDDSIAVVNNQGVVRAMKAGQAIITALGEGGATSSACLVTVVDEASPHEYTLWTTQTGIESSHKWKIGFNLPLDSSTVNQDTVFVTDMSGDLLPVLYLIDSSQTANQLTLSPLEPYPAGEHCTLWIRNVKTSDDRLIQHGVKMDFIVAN